MPRDANPMNPEIQAAIDRIVRAREAVEAAVEVVQPTFNPTIEAPAQEFVVRPEPVVEEGDALYNRQSTLGLNTDTGVTLIGCGGVGVWVALSLALAGVERIDLYDGDTLSTHNLNRYPLPMGFVGETKSLALAQWLSVLRPKGNFQARGEFNPEYHAGNTLSWVVCATDSLVSRKMAHQVAIGNGGYYLEVGADGESWSLSPVPPEFSTELEEQAGYQVTPVHVGPCMMAGAAAAYYILHSQVPVDSHVGKWDGQRITLATMSEEAYATVECVECSWRCREKDLIAMIRHVRAVHYPIMTLAVAKAMVQAWWAPPDSLDEDVVEEAQLAVAAVTEIADWDQEEQENEQA